MAGTRKQFGRLIEAYPSLGTRICKRHVSNVYQLSTKSGAKARIPLLRAPSHLGHYTLRMNRPQNEDRYYAGVLSLPYGSILTPTSERNRYKDQNWQVFNFSVFDGHGGAECSQFLQDNLAKYVEELDMKMIWEIPELYRTSIGGYWRMWKDSEVNKYISRLNSNDDLQLRIPMAYLLADYEYSMKSAKAGSTCTSVYMYSEDPNKAFWEPDQVTTLMVAQVGDTRCILADRWGLPHRLSPIHHPSSPVELERLRRYASHFFTDSFGEERFGRYANTRAFGDLSAKSKGISAEPELVECVVGATGRKYNIPTDRDPGGSRRVPVVTFGGDEAFLAIISDGVSDMVSDQELVDVIMNVAHKQGSGRGTPQEAAQEVVEYAQALGGNDNATCMVVRLSGWGKWEWNDKTGLLREDRLRDAFDSQNRRDRM